MAGSQSAARFPGDDPILSARIEAISQLAGGLTERVAIMDREFNLVYANKATQLKQQSVISHGCHKKCYQVFGCRTEPCESCPAIDVFRTSSSESISCSRKGDSTPCRMQEAFPLVAHDGQVASMLVVFRPPAQSSALSDVRVPEESAPPMTREQLGDLIGRSAAMQQLFDMVSLVADSSATVLIQGESGTGKELVAKTVHQLSYRRDKPFVVVDCGSLPETLLESELFGHVKGAFTGAVSNKPGLFEEAHGGTIFLDEIADTTPTFQAKLLRVLQEGEIKRVGGTQSIKVDARVISATNKDLPALVESKQFRQDLYYRLAVLPLSLPPLRNRKEDIPLLVERFLVAACKRHRQPTRTVSGDLLRALSEATWPGNVRELQHYIERAVVTTTGPTLHCADIMALELKPALDLRSVSRGAMKQAERARIIQALQHCHGNRAQAAKHLKISRAGLYNKIREHGLS